MVKPCQVKGSTHTRVDRTRSNVKSTRLGKFGRLGMECRIGCGACCIAPSISSSIPGMPHGKPAGVRCVQLTDDNQCRLFDSPERPAVCSRLQPSIDMCGSTAGEALSWLHQLELLTTPNS